MTATSRAALVCVLWSATAAWAGLPKVAVHPLKVTDGSQKERDSLQAAFELQVAASRAIETPTSARIAQALSLPQGKGCDLQDTCLRFLAEATNSVYALFATIGLDPRGESYVLSARVMRADGEIVRNIQELTFAKGRAVSFTDGGKAALRELIDRLKLGELDTAVPVARPKVADAARPAELRPAAAPATEVVNRPTVEPETPTLKVVAYAVGGAGVAALAVGGVVGGLALSGKGAITPDASGNVPRSQAGQVAAVNTQGTVSAIALASGAALLATGAVLYFMAPDSPATVAVAPTPGGAAFAIAVPLP